MKKTVKDITVTGKRVLVRVDFNVPFDHGEILDDGRIRAALPTIRYLIEQKARIILLTHLGRPDGFVVESLRLGPVASRLADLLGMPVHKVNNCIGPEVHEAARHMEPGQVLLLENVRFHPGEMVNDIRFAEQLASVAEIFVNDAFGTVHRSHASTTGVAQFLPSVAGLLMESELSGLLQVRDSLRQPIITIVGGDKVVEKLDFLDYSLNHADAVLLGGVVGQTFLKASGYEIGQSQIDQHAIRLARGLLNRAQGKLILPVDVVIASGPAPYVRSFTMPVDQIPPTGWIVDIGPKTIAMFVSRLDQAKTIIWNGPLGVWETPGFAAGTYAIAYKVTQTNAVKIAGGGDTVAVLDRSGVASQMDYLSTGGAAFLNAIQGKTLPGVDVLLEKEVKMGIYQNIGEQP